MLHLPSWIMCNKSRKKKKHCKGSGRAKSRRATIIVTVTVPQTWLRGVTSECRRRKTSRVSETEGPVARLSRPGGETREIG